MNTVFNGHSETRQQRHRKHMLVILGVVGAFAAGLFVGRLNVGVEGDGRVPVTPVTAQAPLSGTSTPNVSQATNSSLGDSDGYDFQTIRTDTAPRASNNIVEAVSEFGFTRLDIDTQARSPRACLQFSQELVADGEVNYGDYVRTSPETKPAISVNGSTMCLSGLSFTQEYRVELRPGLPAADGTTLARAEYVTIAFGDRPAYVGFAGNGVILPRLDADGLAIETVNTEKVKLTVRRVSDRALFRQALVTGEATSADEYGYNYGATDGTEMGVVVWENTLSTQGDRNEVVTTVFPLGAALKELPPGVHFLTVSDATQSRKTKRRKANSWRWIMYTDMALTSYRGSDGMDVFVRSIATARPVTETEIVLIARNNEVLATAKTNADGRVRFEGSIMKATGALSPKMVMAYGSQDDFAVLDLDRTPLDLSEQNIGGRAEASLLDGFIYLDRGIYRPGEIVRISALLRDRNGRAVTGRPMSLKIFRPNGTLAHEERISTTKIGGFSLDYIVSRSAARGVWRIALEADGVDSVASTNYSVEDFVPQRLAVELEFDDKTPITRGEERIVQMTSRFLYGAPAAGLGVEGEVRYRIDPNPFPDQKNYRYGPSKNNISERFYKLPNQVTDEEGRAELKLAGDEAPNGNGTPMRAELVVGVVEPGGRIVKESARIPVRTQERYVGLRLANDKTSFSRKEEAVLEGIILDRDGFPIAGELEWKLVEEDYNFEWYRDGERWRWRRTYRDILIDEGKINTNKDEPAQIRKKLGYGSYRLIAWEQGSDVKTEQKFYVGWRSYGAGAQTPDQAVISFTDDKIVPGTRARLFLDAPYSGEATVVVATDKVHMVQRLKIEENGREIVIDTKPEWGSGFYVMANVVTARDAVTQPIPRRALGVTYVPFDMSDRTLNVAMDIPEVLRPRQKINLPVTIEGASKGEAMMLTLAAVDEGILQLTKFKSPEPEKYYYGKKALGLSIYDDYGRILNANLGAPIRFGGDQIGGAGLSVVPTKSVALFSGLVEIDENGQAQIPIDVPDFNGELRMMAVAWSADKLGSNSQAMTVRDRVPAEISLSRFLSPGDTATATLLIDNVDGEAGTYNIKLAGSGPVALNETLTISLDEKEKQTREIKLTTGNVGIGFVSMEVTGPDNFEVTRAYPIEVRTPWFPTTQSRTITQSPGEKYVLTKALLENYIPGSGELRLSYSPLRGVEPGPLLDALNRYPYGCTEQLTSSSFPLLFVDRLGGQIGRGPEYEVRPRVQAAINKLLDRQSRDGAFGLWRVGDRYAAAWIGPYVTDFLYRAKEAGYAVPDRALEASYSAIAQLTQTARFSNVGYQLRKRNAFGDSTEKLRLRTAAYAHYVLTRAGRADLSDLRYFHDSLLGRTPSPMAHAHIGAALAKFGDNARAQSAFSSALKLTGYENRGNYYQTSLRDAAGLMTLISEAGFTHLIDEASAIFNASIKDPSRMHTQEKAFVLMAANALLKSADSLSIAVDGVELEDLPSSPSFLPSTEDINSSISYENRSNTPLFLTITQTGVPKSAPPAGRNGLNVIKRITTRDGIVANLDTVQQNDRFIITISGTAVDRQTHPLIIADLLPAGFEIETILTPEEGKSYPWLSKLTFSRVAEARDDRFVAAVDVSNRERFTVAYLVRAITPGQYEMPGVVVEDMYRPGVFARTDAGKLSIQSVTKDNAQK